MMRAWGRHDAFQESGISACAMVHGVIRVSFQPQVLLYAIAAGAESAAVLPPPIRNHYGYVHLCGFDSVFTAEIDVVLAGGAGSWLPVRAYVAAMSVSSPAAVRRRPCVVESVISWALWALTGFVAVLLAFAAVFPVGLGGAFPERADDLGTLVVIGMPSGKACVVARIAVAPPPWR